MRLLGGVIGGCAAPRFHYLSNMDWQQAITLLIVLATAALFLRSYARRGAAGSRGCSDHGCGCGKSFTKPTSTRSN